MERQDILPAVYHMLQNSWPTFASVKKTFSMLKKLLARIEILRPKMCDNTSFYTLMRPPGDY